MQLLSVLFVAALLAAATSHQTQDASDVVAVAAMPETHKAGSSRSSLSTPLLSHRLWHNSRYSALSQTDVAAAPTLSTEDKLLQLKAELDASCSAQAQYDAAADQYNYHSNELKLQLQRQWQGREQYNAAVNKCRESQYHQQSTTASILAAIEAIDPHWLKAQRQKQQQADAERSSSSQSRLGSALRLLPRLKSNASPDHKNKNNDDDAYWGPINMNRYWQPVTRHQPHDQMPALPLSPQSAVEKASDDLKRHQTHCKEHRCYDAMCEIADDAEEKTLRRKLREAQQRLEALQPAASHSQQ